MIQANELRIGNLYSQFGHIESISWVNLKELESAPKDQLWCKPMPFTEEWLLRLGFVKKGDNEEYRFEFKKIVNGFVFDFITDWNTQSLDNKFIVQFCKTRTNIKHVHHLQNLYFALTNKELTLCK